ncbi:MAG: DUF6391 domain-containing protein, partial [Anaerolineales bacterium]
EVFPLTKLFSHIINRIRRNHGLEHATLHVLAQIKPETSIAGQSDYFGFWIVGDVSQAEVFQSAQEALRRLQSGEGNLAVHPNCGTNLVASLLLGSLAVFAVLSGGKKNKRPKLERLPLAIALASLTMPIGRSLGAWLQTHVTTSSDVADLSIIDVIPVRRGWLQAQRVQTRG